jgi:hypothetical protein
LMKIFLSILCFLCTSGLQAQNMVINASFEENEECPRGFNAGRYFPVDDVASLFGTADYFNRCSKGRMSTPKNFMGTQEPADGDAYVGIIFSAGSELIGLHLSEELKRDSIYYVSFCYSLAEGSKLVARKLGYGLFDKRVRGKKAATRGFDGFDSSVIKLEEYEDWVQFTQPYTAHGGESFIVIGGLTDWSSPDCDARMRETTKTNYKRGYFTNEGYYYIDQVYVGSTAPPSIEKSVVLADSSRVCMLPVISDYDFSSDSTLQFGPGTETTQNDKVYIYTMETPTEDVLNFILSLRSYFASIGYKPEQIEIVNMNKSDEGHQDEIYSGKMVKLVMQR